MVRRKLLKLTIGTLSKSLTNQRRFTFLLLILLFICGIYYERNLFVDENLPIEFLHYKVSLHSDEQKKGLKTNKTEFFVIINLKYNFACFKFFRIF